MTPLVAVSCLVSSVCAGSAAWLTVGHDRGVHRARLLFGDDRAVDPMRDGPLRVRWSRWAGVLVRRVPRQWMCLPVAGLVSVAGQSVLPLVAGALAVPLAGRWLRARARAGARERRADAVVALCGAAAGEVRAGSQPHQALLRAARSTGGASGVDAPVLAAARFGGDVPAALRAAAREPGAEGLLGLAACWRVAVDGGAGLAAGLDRLEAALRAERDQELALRAQLTGAWSTVVVLAALPVVGLVMGWALGAGPLQVLLHTPAGVACLAVGGLLEAAGLCWAARIVRAGEVL